MTAEMVLASSANEAISILTERHVNKIGVYDIGVKGERISVKSEDAKQLQTYTGLEGVCDLR